ncbi:O-methyltransferase [Pelagicoccus albus]|uniref:O-methyltransferase n=1 Tax=Pelagicoccus albus TaxID=415222 RepID=A0A7X1E9J3_9BACT|nr:O-methyltransferase [Pelagicoccus albus]MBC2607925.1 O-methyltransferase [Pelagicoccus albus]
MVDVLKNFSLQDASISNYVSELLLDDDPALEEVRERSSAADLPGIQLTREDTRHLAFLLNACRAKNVLEIGTLGGYSGLCIARELPADGHLYTVDIEPKHVAVATETFEKYGYAKQVTCIEAPGLEGFAQVAAKGKLDFIFLDADRDHYPEYLELAAEALRPGGLLVADNTFAYGRIASPPADEEEAALINGCIQFNKAILEHPDFVSTILPTGEGLTVGARR